MNLTIRKRTKSHTDKKVLLLIDWDNLFCGLQARFGFDKMDLNYRIAKLMQWVADEVGELWGGYGFVFAPEHLNRIHQELCVENNLRLQTCPKKDGQSVKREDTVDGTLMWFGELMLCHPDIWCICLVSGDADYEPFLKKVRGKKIDVALVVPAAGSLAIKAGILRYVSRNQKTNKFMFVKLDEL